MEDALCGPSNPLQNLRKQTALDRTLQQDHITSRQNGEESFRSLPGPSAGILDSEFDAFQAGLPPPLQEQLPFHPPAQTFAASPKLPEWAADFQRLHLTSTPPSLHPQPVPQHEPPVAWHQDFIQQVSHTQHPHHSHAVTTSSASPQFDTPPGVQFGARFGQQFGTLHNYVSTQEQTNIRKHDVYDDAEFAKAFDAIGQDMAKEGVQQDSSNHLAAQEEADRLKDAEETRNTAAELHGRFEARRIMQEAGIPMTDDGSPTFEDIREPLSTNGETGQRHEDEMEQKQADHQHALDDADELAATAGQLLDSVADNQSTKFGNSKFLELMRKLRDREVRVEGDKMVDVNEVSLSDGPTEIFDATLPDTNAHETPFSSAAPSFIPASEQDTDFGRTDSPGNGVAGQWRQEDAELRYDAYDMDEAHFPAPFMNPLNLPLAG